MPTPAPSPAAGPPPPLVVTLADGRTVALDDVGDPAGTPVVYLHGTPGSRLARHPDEGLAAAAGVRVLALDRPGYGGTDPQPAGAPRPAFAADVTTVLDTLGVDRCAVLAWSGGALDGLALAAGPGDRVSSLTIVAGLVPADAFAGPEAAVVRDAAADRAGMVDIAAEMGAPALAEEVAPMLAPAPCDRALALEHQASQRHGVDAAEVASVPGLDVTLADALVEAVRQGLAGVEADLVAYNEPFPLDLAAVACPVRLWWGTDDAVTPPTFAAWYAYALPDAVITSIAGAGHYVAITHWAELLASLA